MSHQKREAFVASLFYFILIIIVALLKKYKHLKTYSVKTAKALYNEYKRIAYEKNTNIISAADYVQPSETDQEHLTAQGHEILANAIFNAVVSASIV